ncbi:MAG: nucleotide exchange factor GrpE [Candidatus Pacebacteria bacterium]|nr:nucleotide exchange factor GrpE [Candidatus Paceibacterota bacterium]
MHGFFRTNTLNHYQNGYELTMATRKKKQRKGQSDAAEAVDQQARAKAEAGAKDAADQPVEPEVMPPEETEAAEAAAPGDELQKMLDETNEKYVRAKAELENYRKRVQREFGEIRDYTKANTVQEFFSVFDHFQMAMNHVGENPDVETLKQGMDMILTEFRRTFEALGVQPVDAEGKDFDPNEHEAVSHESSDTVPEGKVLRQWKCGYRMGDRLLRPATVIVSSGPEEENDDE